MVLTGHCEWPLWFSRGIVNGHCGCYEDIVFSTKDIMALMGAIGGRHGKYVGSQSRNLCREASYRGRYLHDGSEESEYNQPVSLNVTVFFP